MPTKVQVTAADNELYILAFQWNGSSELLHIKSGNGDPVSTSFNLESVLPKGTWVLTLIGINWGGPWNFKVKIGAFPLFSGSGNGPVGDVWRQNTPAVTI